MGCDEQQVLAEESFETESGAALPCDSLITWPIPEPDLDGHVHPVLAAAARAAAAAYGSARTRHSRAALAGEIADGADGTPTLWVDKLVEEAVADVAQQHRLSLLSEEVGFLDHGSDAVLVVDPVDGSANAASGVPLSCFAGAVVRDGVPIAALTCWLDTGRCWSASLSHPVPYRTTGRKILDCATVNLIRPRHNTFASWLRIARRLGRIRMLGTTCLEAMLVAEGSIDAFADPGSDTHRIIDLAAALLTVPAAGGAVVDVWGRPLEFDLDLTRRWSGVIAATPELAEQLADAIKADANA